MNYKNGDVLENAFAEFESKLKEPIIVVHDFVDEEALKQFKKATENVKKIPHSVKRIRAYEEAFQNMLNNYKH